MVGLPESEVDQLIAPLYRPYTNPTTTLLATLGRLNTPPRSGRDDDREEARLAELGDKIELALGDHVYSTRGESLEEVVAGTW